MYYKSHHHKIGTRNYKKNIIENEAIQSFSDSVNMIIMLTLETESNKLFAILNLIN